MAIDVLDKLQKLLALTTSPIEGEASAAAVHACALIRKYEVVCSLPKSAKPTTDAWDDIFGGRSNGKPQSPTYRDPPHRPEPSAPAREAYGQQASRPSRPSPAETYADEQAHQDAAADLREDDVAAHGPDPADADADGDTGDVQYTILKHDYQIRPSKFRGKCARCSRAIRIGSTVVWKPGRMLDPRCAEHEGVIGRARA